MSKSTCPNAISDAKMWHTLGSVWLRKESNPGLSSWRPSGKLHHQKTFMKCNSFWDSAISFAHMSGILHIRQHPLPRWPERIALRLERRWIAKGRFAVFSGATIVLVFWTNCGISKTKPHVHSHHRRQSGVGSKTSRPRGHSHPAWWERRPPCHRLWK